jgi:hypothetical protein
MTTKGNEADGASQPGAAEKEFLEVPFSSRFRKMAVAISPTGAIKAF